MEINSIVREAYGKYMANKEIDHCEILSCFDTYVMIKKTHKMLDDNLAIFRKKYDLKNAELNIMYFIGFSQKVHKEEWSIKSSDISSTMQLNKGQVSIALDSLLEKGFIECKNSDKDKRITYFRLTPEGEKITDILNTYLEKFNSRIREQISDEEMKIFSKVFNCYLKEINNILD